MTQTNNIWLRAVITLKKFSDASTKTIYISNRPLLDYTGTTTYYPILKRISGLGTDGSRYIPANSSGQIVLDNTPGSFGEARRFSDLLELYTEVEQSIAIYAAETTALDADPHADFELIATTTIKRGRQGPDTFVLDVESQGVPRGVITKLVNSSEMQTAPDRSIGRALPIIFGQSQEVQAILLDNEGDQSPKFGYGTTFADDYVLGGVTGYYLKDTTGKYRAVQSKSTSTRVFEDDLSGLVYTSATVSSELSADTYRALEISGSSSTPCVITQGYVYFTQAASATIYGSYEFEIWEKDANNGGPGTKIASAKRKKSTITHNTGSANKVEFCFDKPAILNSPNGYFIAIKQQATNGSANLRLARYTGSTTDTYWTFSNNAWSEWQNTIDGNPPEMYWGLYAINMSDDPDPISDYWDSEGRGHAAFELSMRTAPTGCTNPDISALDFIVTVDGLEDNGSGTITGSANSTIQSPRHAARLLLMQWDGSSWADSLLDATKYDTQNDAVELSTSATYRRVAGTTRGRTGIEVLLNDICRSASCRLVRHNGATEQLAIWPWGNTETNAQLDSVDIVFTDENCTVNEVVGGDRSNIINDFVILYDRGLIYSETARAAAEGVAKEYRGALKWKPTTEYEGVALGAQSYALYGYRELAVETFNFIADDASANIVARYLNATHNFPSKTARIDLIDFWEFRDLDLMDVVYILHPDLPSYYGTDPNAKEPTDDDGSPHFLADGKRLVQAKRYRGIIEGSQINWNLDGDGLLTRSLAIRLLTNENDPT